MSRDDLQKYYASNDEASRLSDVHGQLEFERSQDIISRRLPPLPAVVLDVGGAAGRYACWLASRGYEVHLVDPVAGLVDQARAASGNQPEAPIASCTVGDARNLSFDDQCADALLMLGPLYHLIRRDDRLTALREARRVLKPGGVLFAAGISRFASVIDGLVREFLLDADFRQIVAADVATGRHKNPTGRLEYFTDSFFHSPEELEAETVAAGFTDVQVCAVEGVACLLSNLESYWRDEDRKKILMETLRSVEQQRSMTGATSHLMCVADRL